MYSFQPSYSITRDWNKLQGTSHASDLTTQIIRDYNSRYITIENSSPRPIGVAITPYISGPTPPILFTLAGGEIKHLGINSQGGPAQSIWMLDVQTHKPVGNPTVLRRDANSFVLRDALSKWYVHFFKRASYAAAK